MYVDTREKRPKRQKGQAYRALGAYGAAKGEDMVSYLDIAREVAEQLRLADQPPDLDHVRHPAPSPNPFTDWVRRPDCHGRMGWEAPDLPEWRRWWDHSDFEDLPPVPEGFRFDAVEAPAHHDCTGCVSGGTVDTLDLGEDRPTAGPFRGPGAV